MNSNVVADFHVDYYESGVWAHTFWRGHTILKFPTDLLVYQEIIHDVRPDLIIECGTHRGGSALFLGDMCELTGNGRVVSIDTEPERTPSHQRVSYIRADSGDAATADKIAVARGACVMVILDSLHTKAHVLRELAVWSPLVSVGSYLIVEDCNLSGHPVDKQGQPGPWEALEEWLPQHPEFERDLSREKFGLTANPGGYLRRINQCQ